MSDISDNVPESSADNSEISSSSGGYNDGKDPLSYVPENESDEDGEGKST